MTQTTNRTFVHLRVQSDYSVLKAASKVKHLFAAAKALGQPALALTDEAALYGGMEAVKYGVDSQVQPILGAKLYVPVNLGRSAVKGVGKGSVLILSRTQAGYANVCRLINVAVAAGDATLSRDELARVYRSRRSDADLAAGIVCLGGSGADSCLGAAFRDGGRDAVRAMAKALKDTFGDDYMIEVCRNGYPTEAEVKAERAALEMAVELNVPIVATSEVLYATAERHDAYAILRAVDENRKGGVMVEADGIAHGSPRRHHLRSLAEMEELFADLPEALQTATIVALRCVATAPKRKPILPSFTTDGGRSEAEELRLQARHGLAQRLATAQVADRAAYEERLEYEVDVIEKMGFPGYFLIVSDFIKFAKGKGIPVGPGRGSGAGSVVAWALTITDLDPLRFGLLFERFLNPERVSMPDFDIDFCQVGRDAVIRYVEQRYGRERVAGIATFGEMKTKSCIRDVARVVSHVEEGGLSQMEINGLAAMVPDKVDGKVPKLKDCYDMIPEFAARTRKDARGRAVYENSLKVEGLFRQTGAHAAGIIIAGDTLTNLVPVGQDPKTGFPMVQLNMKDSENAGMVKFDFLGLTTLTVINEALAHVRKYEGIDVDLASVPLDDRPTLDLFAKGLTTGVFQFESDGMKNALREVNADRIEDLIAVNALFRPGPMQFISDYAACKSGRQQPRYPEPVDRTKPFLEETYGIMVYQEQVMQVAQASAGYSLGGADLLRRAMGKKIKEEMDAQRATFVEGCIKTNRLSQKAADALFDQIAKFADYGFNKSHAAAYSVVAYHTGYLKAHHRICFFAATLSCYADKVERLALIKQDMEQFGIDFMPPDVNASFARFSPERKADGTLGLRFGLMAVKGVTSDKVDTMVEERERGGRFSSLEDFHARVGGLFNSAQVQKLAESGALDSLTQDRNRARAFEALTYLAKNNKRDDATIDLFATGGSVVVKQSILATPEWGNLDIREFDALGFFLGEHPLKDIEQKMFARGGRKRLRIVEHMLKEGLSEMRDKKLYGLVEAFEVKQGNRGPYVRLKLAESQDTYWINVYNDDTDRVASLLTGAKETRKPVVVKAAFSPGNGGPGDMFVRGSEVHTCDEYIKNNWRKSRWTIRVDPLDPTLYDPTTLRAVEEIHRKAHDGPKDEAFKKRCFDEMKATINPFAKEMMGRISAAMGRASDVATPSDVKHDEVVLTVKLRVGPWSEESDFNVAPPAPGSLDLKEMLSPLPGVRSVASVHLGEVVH